MLCVALMACGEPKTGKTQSTGIVLGDSATIVTETDSTYLEELVPDFKEPVEAEEPVIVTAKDTPLVAPLAPAADAVKSVDAKQETGFTLDLGTVKLVYTGIDTKEYKKQDPKTQNGLSYAVTTGKLSNSKLLVYGAKNVKVRQRYQSSLQIKGSLGKLDLPGYYTSEWISLDEKASGKAPSFTFPGIANPTFINWSAAKIRSTAEAALKKQRISSKNLQSWRKDLKKVRSTKSSPCDIVLQNVQWQISGTDEKGKAFQRTIRMEP